jgi:hypothetical protein
MNDGGPAFPETGERGRAIGGEGLSARDYFAAAALTGWIVALSRRAQQDGYGDSACAEYAPQLAYTSADAMLEARKQGET